MVRVFTMPSSLSFCLIYFLSLANALPWSGARPTVAYDAADWTPVPTTSPQPQDLKRTFFPQNVCGFIGGKANEPALCSESSSCVWDTVNSVVGCCPIDGPCTVGVYTGCVDGNSPSQTTDDPAMFTCTGDSVCYQNNYPGDFRQYGCGSTSALATTVETSFTGQPTNVEIWIVSTSFVITSTAAPLKASTTSAPVKTAKLTTIVGEIDSILTTVVGKISSGVIIATSTSTTPVMPTFFSNTTMSAASTPSTSAVNIETGNSNNNNIINSLVLPINGSIGVATIISTSSNTNSPSLLTSATTSSISTSIDINPIVPFSTVTTSPTVSSTLSITFSGTSPGSSVLSAGESASSSASTSAKSSSKDNKKVVIATTVGVGGAAIISIAAVALFFLHRRRQQTQGQIIRETPLLTPIRPARSDDSFRIHFDYPYSPDDVASPTSPTAREPPVFPPPPNSENNAPAPNLFSFSSFPQPPSYIPSQAQSSARTQSQGAEVTSPLSRKETLRSLTTPLTTTFDQYGSAVREAISIANSPRKYTPVPVDEEGAWREELGEVERVRNATRVTINSNGPERISGLRTAPVILGPGMVNMF